MPSSSHYGFRLVSEQHIPEIQSHARLWEHIKTGAKLVSLENQDQNKSFAITFPTLPTDHTGVAHILEHSVLNGSRKYPVKEPFVELMKSSVCSFLNAFTYPDKTVYPLASQNEQDFYNLIDVYLDAVFFPTLSESTFLQEGWHYEPIDQGWIYKGVVFNEMKGAGLSPDRYLWQETQAALFPDTPYVWDSGGVPEYIVDLTYQQFQQFHRDNYHPSRALIWMSGNDDPDRRLRTLAEYLDQFSAAADSFPEIPLQTWSGSVRRHTAAYPTTSPEDTTVFATRSWVVTDATDVATQIELSVLEYVLIGSSTAPLRKALIDSELGDDLAGGGLELDVRQKTFSVGLRGVQPDAVEQVFAVLTNTLESLVASGFAQDAIAAALNTIEFSLRENNSGNFPQGLSLGLRVLRGWLYGAEPLELLSFEDALQKVRQKLTKDPGYLQQLLRQVLLENPHSVEVVLRPDAHKMALQQAVESNRLQKFAQQLSPETAQKLRKTATDLQEAQRTPDSPESLQTLPQLLLSDLPKQTPVVPTQPLTLAGCSGFVHELPTNGVVYFDFAWSLDQLATKNIPLLSLFAAAWTELGTTRFPESELQTAIDTRSGGVSTQVFIGQKVASDDPVEQLFLRVKALPQQLPALFELLESLIVETDWSNQRRFKQLILEEKAQFEASLADEGHRLVASRLGSHVTPAGAVAEQLSGVTQLQFLRALAQKIKSDWSSIESELRLIQTAVFSSPVQWNVTVSADDSTQVLNELTQFLQQFADRAPKKAAAQRQVAHAELTAEALTMSSPVNFVGTAVRLPKNEELLSGAVLVATQLLRTDYLWNAVRVQGGAYGAGIRIEPVSGVVVATSYRDPHLTETVQVFQSVGQYLQDLSIAPRELEKAKLGTIGDLDQYRLPDAKGFLAFVQHMTGMGIQHRQKLRDQVFATTIDDLRQLGKQLIEVGMPYVAAVTAPEKAHQLAPEVQLVSLTTQPQSENAASS